MAWPGRAAARHAAGPLGRWETRSSDESSRSEITQLDRGSVPAKRPLPLVIVNVPPPAADRWSMADGARRPGRRDAVLAGRGRSRRRPARRPGRCSAARRRRPSQRTSRKRSRRIGKPVSAPNAWTVSSRTPAPKISAWISRSSAMWRRPLVAAMTVPSADDAGQLGHGPRRIGGVVEHVVGDYTVEQPVVEREGHGVGDLPARCEAPVAGDPSHGLVDHPRREVGQREVDARGTAASRIGPHPTRTAPDLEHRGRAPPTGTARPPTGTTRPRPSSTWRGARPAGQPGRVGVLLGAQVVLVAAGEPRSGHVGRP